MYQISHDNIPLFRQGIHKKWEVLLLKRNELINYLVEHSLYSEHIGALFYNGFKKKLIYVRYYMGIPYVFHFSKKELNRLPLRKLKVIKRIVDKMDNMYS